MSNDAISALEVEVVRLQQALEQSAANHNVIIGALEQTKAILAQLKSKQEAPQEAPQVTITETVEEPAVQANESYN